MLTQSIEQRLRPVYQAESIPVTIEEMIERTVPVTAFELVPLEVALTQEEFLKPIYEFERVPVSTEQVIEKTIPITSLEFQSVPISIEEQGKVTVVTLFVPNEIVFKVPTPERIKIPPGRIPPTIIPPSVLPFPEWKGPGGKLAKIKKKKIDGCWEDPHFLKNLKPPV